MQTSQPQQTAVHEPVNRPEAHESETQLASHPECKINRVPHDGRTGLLGWRNTVDVELMWKSSLAKSLLSTGAMVFCKVYINSFAQ